MTLSADFLIIGGGVAGLSAAYCLAAHGSVLVLEAESALGYHSSGRSATFYHFGIGDSAVRAMTAYSRDFFENPPGEFSEVPLSLPTPALFIATSDMVPALDELQTRMSRFTDSISRLDERATHDMVPILRVGDGGIVASVVDTSARRLDADALLQGYARAVKRSGSVVRLKERLASLTWAGGCWTASTQGGNTISAPLLINAAGAWADEIATMAGVRPLGLRQLRRTIIQIDGPADMAFEHWPFTKTAVDDFYMLPGSGRLMASPVDEVPDAPTDARPEDYDLALAAWKVEQYTTLSVERIPHKWAGLRTFTADRVPTAGFAADHEHFFWLAGQGGYGLQTAPAMADIVVSGILGAPWPEHLSALGLSRDQVTPQRLLS